VKLTDVNDADVEVPASQIVLVEEQPVGQCLITLSGGVYLQVKESVEQVRKLMKEETQP
jgi:uncharacterized protein YlzI (FlbEa/FlbD family)